jgi:hypothetical protein
MAQRYFDGSIAQTPFALSIRPLYPAGCELRFNTVRGFFYNLQSTTDLGQPFMNGPAGFVQAFDTSMVLTDTVALPKNLFRVARSASP